MALKPIPLTYEQLLARKLRAIADVIETEPHRWTQHAIARDEHGNRVVCNSPDAVCWCVSGWLMRTDVRNLPSLRAALKSTMNGLTNVPAWNDQPKRTAQDVVTMFRSTAAILETIK